MSKSYHIIGCCIMMCAVFIFPGSANAAGREKAENSCVHCHSQLPGTSFVGVKSHSWKGSVHQMNGVTCDKCHGGNPQASGEREAHEGVLGSSNPKSTVYYKNVPVTCGKCHGAEFYKFTQSLHYRRLESTGQGPDCVTCHGSMVTTVLSPDTVAAVCERCHNERMGIFPYIPQKAKAVLLSLKVSEALLDADGKLYGHTGDKEIARSLRDAQSSLHSAKLDWHRFDLDTVTGDLQGMYNVIRKLPPRQPRR
jgi:Cytochrome c7 and related cytochrome c/Cytochrome c554 and c-prime